MRREQRPTIPAEGEIPLGSRIRARRWLLGWPLAAFAQAVGDYDASHISHVELGRANPSDELLTGIATVLDISIEELERIPREELLSWLEQGSPTPQRGAGVDRQGSADEPRSVPVAPGESPWPGVSNATYARLGAAIERIPANQRERRLEAIIELLSYRP